MKSGLKFYIICLFIVSLVAAPYTLYFTAAKDVSASSLASNVHQEYPSTPPLDYATTTPTSTMTPTYAPPTATNTATMPPTYTAMPTVTDTPVYTATTDPYPTNTSTVLPTYTATEVPTETPTATSTEMPAYTPTMTNTPVDSYPSPTATYTAVPTYTATSVPTYTVTSVPTYTATSVPTYTATAMPTYTVTVMPTEEATEVPTYTVTPEPTATQVPTYTATPEQVPTYTATPVPTYTATPEPREGAMLYISPEQVDMVVGETYELEVMVNPGLSAVNGVQVHAKVDPAYLKILSVEADRSELDNVLEAATFVTETGVFRYSAGLLNENADSETFSVLRLEVEALAVTDSTMIEFLQEDTQSTDVAGPDGSVLEEVMGAEVTIRDEVALYGRIGLQGRPSGASESNAISVTVEVYPAGGVDMLKTFEVMLDQDAEFTYTDLMSGTYDLRLMSEHVLVTKALSVVVNSEQDTRYLGQLKEGDVTQDNSIGLEDFSILSGAFHRCDTDEDFDDRTDLNEDGCTSLTDFSLLAGNYNTDGDVLYNTQDPEPLSISEPANAKIELQAEAVADKAVGDTFEVIVSVDPNGGKVQGTTAHIVFDPTLVSVTKVELLAEQLLPTTLQKEQDQVNNEDGSVIVSQGSLGESATERFELAKLTLEVKQEHDGSSLAFSNNFPPTDVTSAQGNSLLSGTTGQSGGNQDHQLFLPVILR